MSGETRCGVRCERCGTRYAAGSPLGCPQCLVGAGLEVLAEGPPSAALSGFQDTASAPPGLSIQERIGAGGMGVVYRAHDEERGCAVALKILHADTAVLPHLEREVEALRRLRHPGIVGVLGAGVHEGRPYLVLEYVDGVDLRRLLRTGPLAPERAISIVRDVALALDEAHGQGVVHRDVKPENVLVDREGRARVADFGLARLSDPDGTCARSTQAIAGTPVYMAPEQIESPQSIDGRADVYSLGVVLYELLCGELPMGRFDPPSVLASVPKSFDAVVMRALHKRPERRFTTAAEMAGAIDAALGFHAREPRHASQRLRRIRTRPRSTAGAWLRSLCVLAFAAALLAQAAGVPPRAAALALAASLATVVVGERWSAWYPRPGCFGVLLVGATAAAWCAPLAVPRDVAQRMGVRADDTLWRALAALHLGYLGLVVVRGFVLRTRGLGRSRVAGTPAKHVPRRPAARGPGPRSGDGGGEGT